MTSTIDVKMGEKVLEIGTGSGYQSAYLANLTDRVWTIEIIKPLAERTRGVYDALDHARIHGIQRDHEQECRRLLWLAGGCAVRQDHRHLRHRPHPAASAAAAQAGGIMVIPVGPPGAQHMLKIIKEQAADGMIDGCAVRHIRRQDRSLRAVHQARRRRDQGDAQPTVKRVTTKKPWLDRRRVFAPAPPPGCRAPDWLRARATRQPRDEIPRVLRRDR